MLTVVEIWTLNMSAKKKWAVTGVFAVGIMSVAAAFTRLVIQVIVLNYVHAGGFDINRTSLISYSIQATDSSYQKL